MIKPADLLQKKNWSKKTAVFFGTAPRPAALRKLIGRKLKHQDETKNPWAETRSELTAVFGPMARNHSTEMDDLIGWNLKMAGNMLKLQPAPKQGKRFGWGVVLDFFDQLTKVDMENPWKSADSLRKQYINHYKSMVFMVFLVHADY